MSKRRQVTSTDKFGIVSVTASPLRISNSDKSEMVSQLLMWEPIYLLNVSESWIEIKTHHDNYVGFIDKKHVHPVKKEEFDIWTNDCFRSHFEGFKIDTLWGQQFCLPGSFITMSSIVEWGPDLKRLKLTEIPGPTPFEKGKYFMNTPYLWGGKSTYGIDCSGFTQLIFDFFDIHLPRDAYQQAELGLDINFDDTFEFALAFFANSENKITHVGIINKNYDIIHASGKIRIDRLDQKGIYNDDIGSYTHNFHSLRKYRKNV